jgi:hypothetical protein
MRRRIPDIIAVLSAVVLLSVVAMWARSHRVADVVGYGAKFARGGDGAYMIRFVLVARRGAFRGGWFSGNVPARHLGA